MTLFPTRPRSGPRGAAASHALARTVMSKYNPSRNNRFASLTRDLPPAKRRMLRRNLMFVTLTLSLIGLLTLVAKANAAGRERPQSPASAATWAADFRPRSVADFS